MGTPEQPSIDLPIEAKDIFRILALRSVAENSNLYTYLNKGFEKFIKGVKKTERLDSGKPFDCGHKEKPIAKKILNDFTEREMCASERVFFKRKFDPIGEVIDYEIPLDEKKDSARGKIDLLSVCKNSNQKIIYLLEVKKCQSNELPLRAFFEIVTFWLTLRDDNGSFNDFLGNYKDGIYAKYKVVPGLLMCRSSKIYMELMNSGSRDAICDELYKKFRKEGVGVKVFSYIGDEKPIDEREVFQITVEDQTSVLDDILKKPQKLMRTVNF